MKETFMKETCTRKRPTAIVRISFFALALVMAAATLHLGAQTAHAAQATLSWAAPTTYTDGSALTTLKGYKVNAGTASGSFTQNVDVGNMTSYTMSGLNDATTYYFAVTAYDTAGMTSGYSTEAKFVTAAGTPAATLYTLSASAGSGGSITPSGSLVISKGTNQTYSIAPATGYKIAGVTVDGASVGAVSSYTFSNIAAGHSISATFAAATTTTASYSITATAYSNGSISPAGTVAVTSGGSKTYTITPKSGYVISALVVDGVSVTRTTTYTFSAVKKNHTIAVSFKLK